MVCDAAQAEDRRTMIDKNLAAIVATAASLINSAVYMRVVWQGKIKPHMFSWFVWGLLMLIGAAAQYSDGAGVGAWTTGFGGFMCLALAVQAYFYGEKNITRSDWLSFLAALSALPVWHITSDPLGAVLIVTFIDCLGAYPTFRKSYRKPHEEAVFVFLVLTFISVMRVMAIEQYTLITTVYPASLVALNALLVLMLLWRRRVMVGA